MTHRKKAINYLKSSVVLIPLTIGILGFSFLLKSLLFRNEQISRVFQSSEIGQQTPPPSSPAPQPTPRQAIVNNEVRALPGKMDNSLMFNSNSPEWIKKEGILLSTFPPEGKQTETAHLNFPMEGEFTLFAHHFTHEPPDLQTLYLGIIVSNPNPEPVTLEILAGASYLLEPEGPFKRQPQTSENPEGEIYSGPGIRAVDNVLRGWRQEDFPDKLILPPGESKMLLNHPIPVRDLERPVNGRSTFMELKTSGKIYLASMAMYAKKQADGSERPPTNSEWQQLLTNGNLALPRDKTPTPPKQTSGALIYGRVAGVQEGSGWLANIADSDGDSLKIPAPGRAFSYVISTLRGGTLGTGQVQAARMLVRYPDTAYRARGNYGVRYDLTLPLFNPTDKPQTVTVTLETPYKEEILSKGGLIFRQPPWDFPYFRGTVRLRYEGNGGEVVTRYLHLWHRRGELVAPLLELNLAAGEKRQVRVDFLYPPDSVPPQVLTVRTVNN